MTSFQLRLSKVLGFGSRGTAKFHNPIINYDYILFFLVLLLFFYSKP